ncbi:SDR family NAD(P)-dependent oxidoreductase [Maricaulis sp.]|uniref:SDR family NAD(P)-dependent oxidoreductase n=1 Tax=Maricaulis sp. TaxID=1486257 RepID=UPI003A922307
MTNPTPSAVVTGASTGIGHACTAELAAKGWHVFAGVRKQADADRLKEEFGTAVTPLIMEVTDMASMQSAADTVRATLNGVTLKGLINNAGIAVAGPMLTLPIEEFQQQMDVNVTGVVRTTQAFGPLLGADESLTGDPGRIVMISSVAGEMGAPFLGPYSASKHAVEGLSKSLRREMMLFGIEVIVLGPGAVATPIWSKSDEVDITPYEGSVYYKALTRLRNYMSKSGPEGFPPSVIADRAFRALTEDKPRFRYALVPQRLTNWSLPRMLPERMVNNILAKRLGLTRRER